MNHIFNSKISNFITIGHFTNRKLIKKLQDEKLAMSQELSI